MISNADSLWSLAAKLVRTILHVVFATLERYVVSGIHGLIDVYIRVTAPIRRFIWMVCVPILILSLVGVLTGVVAGLTLAKAAIALHVFPDPLESAGAEALNIGLASPKKESSRALANKVGTVHSPKRSACDHKANVNGHAHSESKSYVVSFADEMHELDDHDDSDVTRNELKSYNELNADRQDSSWESATEGLADDDEEDEDEEEEEVGGGGGGGSKSQAVPRSATPSRNGSAKHSPTEKSILGHKGILRRNSSGDLSLHRSPSQIEFYSKFRLPEEYFSDRSYIADDAGDDGYKTPPRRRTSTFNTPTQSQMVSLDLIREEY